MKIKYLGTAAYEGVPSLFCKCRVCTKARALGGRNLRSRSQALVNDELLLDFNPDTYWHYQKYAFDWEKICACLITHSHCDHLYPDDVEAASEGYSHEHRPLVFYVAADGYEKLKAVTDKTHGGASVIKIEAGEAFQTAGGYRVLPLRANHSEHTTPVIYSISHDGKRMLYAHDTGVFFEDTWEGLKREGHFDFLSLDCTGCLGLGRDWRNGHMSMQTNLEMTERMKKEGLIDEKTVIVLNHFSHNGGQIYDEMTEEAQKHGFIVSYDGLEIEF